MQMSTILNISLLALAGLSLLAAVVSVARAFGARSSAPRQAYNVGQVEARRSTQVNFVRAGFFLLLSLIFLGVYGILPTDGGGAAAPEAIDVDPGSPVAPPQETLPVLVSTIPPLPSPTVAAEPTATPQPAPPTATPMPSPTPVPQPETATVSSGVGVWLRSAPGTGSDQLEWLLDGTVVTLLEGRQSADDLQWQAVRTEAGAEGWVALDYLTLGAAQP